MTAKDNEKYKWVITTILDKINRFQKVSLSKVKGVMVKLNDMPEGN